MIEWLNAQNTQNACFEDLSLIDEWYLWFMKKTAIILVNLGTPDAPTPKSVRRYLKEFLSDTRVIEIPKLIWQVINWFCANHQT